MNDKLGGSLRRIWGSERSSGMMHDWQWQLKKLDESGSNDINRRRRCLA